MYAVIKTGGKQYKVAEGDTLEVDRLSAVVGKSVDFPAVMLVDGAKVLATADEVAKAKVTAKVVADAKGPKITGFKYKNKSRVRRRWGHRAKLTTIEISKISKGTAAKAAKASEEAGE